MGHYSGGTLNDTGAMRKRLRTLDRRLTAAVTASGSQPNQTTDKVNSINTDVQSALDAADKAQSDATDAKTTASQASSDAAAARTAASDAQSDVTVLTSRLAASTVLSTRVQDQIDGVASYYLELPGAPGADRHAPALATIGVLGRIGTDVTGQPNVVVGFVDPSGSSKSVVWYGAPLGDAATYPGYNSPGVFGMNGSFSVMLDGYSGVMFEFHETYGHVMSTDLWLSIRVDYPPAAPEASSLMAVKPVDGGGPTMPVIPAQPDIPAPSSADATASQSTDIKEQS